MTTTFTIIDDLYSANLSNGHKVIWGTTSTHNPYTTGGESITTSSYFPSKFLGGAVMAVNGYVSIAAVGPLKLATMRADTSSTSTITFQLLDVGVGTSFGRLIDMSGEIHSATAQVMLWGY